MLQIDFENLRDNITGTLDANNVAFANVFPRDFVLVVQGGAAHDHAADRDGLKLGHRRQRAGSAHLNNYLVQFCFSLFRRELVRDGPARRAADETEPLLPVGAVELVHHAVDVERQFMPPFLHLAVVGEDFFRIFAKPRRLVHVEAPLFQPMAQIVLRFGLLAAHFTEGIREKLQRTPGGNAGVQLPHASGSGVARIGE